MTWPNWQKINTVCKINLQALDLKSTENFSKAFFVVVREGFERNHHLTLDLVQLVVPYALLNHFHHAIST